MTLEDTLKIHDYFIKTKSSFLFTFNLSNNDR